MGNDKNIIVNNNYQIGTDDQEAIIKKFSLKFSNILLVNYFVFKWEKKALQRLGSLRISQLG